MLERFERVSFVTVVIVVCYSLVSDINELFRIERWRFIIA